MSNNEFSDIINDFPSLLESHLEDLSVKHMWLNVLELKASAWAKSRSILYKVIKIQI